MFFLIIFTEYSINRTKNIHINYNVNRLYVEKSNLYNLFLFLRYTEIELTKKHQFYLDLLHKWENY